MNPFAFEKQVQFNYIQKKIWENDKKYFKMRFLKLWGYLHFLNAFPAIELLYCITEHTGLHYIIIMEKDPIILRVCTLVQL